MTQSCIQKHTTGGDPELREPSFFSFHMPFECIVQIDHRNRKYTMSLTKPRFESFDAHYSSLLYGLWFSRIKCFYVLGPEKYLVQIYFL